MKKIFLLNYAPPSSSIYKYSQRIYECTSEYSEQINLRYSNRSNKWEQTVQGRIFESPVKNVLSANILFSSVFFRNARKYILNSSGKDRVVHYTHQTLSPFKFDLERSVVSIHDNPYTGLKYGVYTSDRQNTIDKMMFRLYSRSIKHNLARYMKFKYVITTSDYVKNSLIKYGFRNEITTIYPPVGNQFVPMEGKEKIREELKLPRDKRLLLSVSTDQPRKNLKLLEQLMKRLDKSFQLVRVGKPILNSINFSNVDQQTINKIYNACDVLVMPSFEEGFGSPVAEAMTVGLPVACSDIEIFHELCGKYAFYFDPNSVEDFERSVTTAVENLDLYKDKMIERSRNFSHLTFCSNINNYYNQKFFM